MEPIQIPLKRKYRPKGGEGDYFYAKKCGINGDHNNRKRKRHHGPKTYDRTKHILLIRANGKRRMIHLREG